MCRAMEEWAIEEREIGRERGLQEGRESGLREGRERGLREGRERGLREGRERGLQEGRESGLREGRESGLREGRTEERKLFIVRMLERNKTDEEIIDITDCTKKQLEEIKEKFYTRE